MTWVFLHGAASGPEVWSRQHHVVPQAVWFRYPETEAEPDQLLEEYATAVLTVGPDPLVLVGHSLGGAVAQLAALADPSRVAGLILVATGPRLPVNPALLEGLQNAPAEALDRIARWSLARSAPATLLERSRTLVRRTDPALAHRQLAACARFDIRGRRTPSLPVAVIAGADDRMTPPALVTELLDTWPGARRTEIAGAGHLVMQEQPDAFNAALTAFADSQGWPHA
jgi:pimeloyl-ACP methyl ester carboxylesterase